MFRSWQRMKKIVREGSHDANYFGYQATQQLLGHFGVSPFVVVFKSSKGMKCAEEREDELPS